MTEHRTWSTRGVDGQRLHHVEPVDELRPLEDDESGLPLSDFDEVYGVNNSRRAEQAIDRLIAAPSFMDRVRCTRVSARAAANNIEAAFDDALRIDGVSQ